MARLNYAVFCLLTLITTALIYAQPIVDNDFWWQISYGRFLSESGFFVLDHSLFTWTSVDTSSIYTAWFAELSLYHLYDLGGLDALFTFRYFVYLCFIGLSVLAAFRLNLLKTPAIWLFILLGMLMSQSARFIKPEIFSFLVFSVIIFLWIYLKTQTESAWKYTYIFPLLFLVWINSHGGFIFGGVFLAVMLFGEFLNVRFNKIVALDSRVLKHLIISSGLTFVTLFLTPYGFDYPSSLITGLFQQAQNFSGLNGLQDVHAYKTIFHESANSFHYLAYLSVSVVILCGLFYLNYKRYKVDFAILLVNLVFALLYANIIRVTYFFAPIFVFSALLLFFRAGISHSLTYDKRFNLVGLFLVFFLSYKGISTNLITQTNAGWFGFGISYDSPVPESNFIKSLPPELKIGNDYNSGGFLIWDLWPRKVFIDSRYFPFLDWYDEYREFMRGNNVRNFLKKYPADLWLLPYGNTKVESYFLSSPNWKLAFYGPTAAVYVNKSSYPQIESSTVATEIDAIQNFRVGLLFVEFASKIGDYDSAQKAINGMRALAFFDEHKERVDAGEKYLNGLISYYEGEYRQAAQDLEYAGTVRVLWNDKILNRTYNQLTVASWQQNKFKDAWYFANKAWQLEKSDVVNIYNLGAIEWYLSNTANEDTKLNWEQKLREFQSLVGSKSRMPKSILDASRAMLQTAASSNIDNASKPPLIQLPSFKGPKNLY